MKQPSHPSQETKLKVIAGIPCFNTGSTIADVVSKANKYVDQVIVIDDGSHDGTAETARAAGALVTNHGTHRGYGKAVKSCFEAAKANNANVLVILDGDGQHNPNEIPKLLTPILRGEAQLIIGSRFLTKGQNIPRYRRFGIRVITFLWDVGSKVRISDAQSGFRAYSKEIFEVFSLSERGMSTSIEILEEARSKGVTIKEVPVSCLYVSSTINLKTIKHGLGVAFAVVKIRLKSTLNTLVGANNARNQSS